MWWGKGFHILQLQVHENYCSIQLSKLAKKVIKVILPRLSFCADENKITLQNIYYLCCCWIFSVTEKHPHRIITILDYRDGINEVIISVLFPLKTLLGFVNTLFNLHFIRSEDFASCGQRLVQVAPGNSCQVTLSEEWCLSGYSAIKVRWLAFPPLLIT